jgi:putative membrane protein
MLKWTLVLIATVGLVLSARAADTPKADVFAAEAAGANMFEIESSRLALTKTKSEAVRNFANKMIADHTAAAGKFKKAIADAKMKAPAEGLDAKHKAIYDDLRKKDGEAFDKAYIQAQHKGHMEAVELFQSYAGGGDNPRLKQFAQEMLPTLRAHLELVSKMD